MDEKIDGESYGDRYASLYDDLFDDRDDIDTVVGVLHELAGADEVLELGVGTGRLAIPLARRGHVVHGVDISEAMLARLVAKLGDAEVAAVRGDFASCRVERPISLVFCAFSTLFCLPDQDAQLATLRNAASHLGIGGRLLVEFFVHDRTRFVDEQRSAVTDIDVRGATFQASLLAPNEQVIVTQSVTYGFDATRVLPNRLRFIYPAEFRLMARLAGFELVDCWSDWDKSAFTSTSGNFIGVCEKVSETPF